MYGKAAPEKEVCQRQVIIGGRQIVASSLRRRTIEGLVRDRAPEIINEVMRVYDTWIGDGIVEGRRFRTQQELIDELINHVRGNGRGRSSAPRIISSMQRPSRSVPPTRNRSTINNVIPPGRLRGGRVRLQNALNSVSWPPNQRPHPGDLVYGVDAERSNLMRSAQSQYRRNFGTHMEIGSNASTRVPFYINPLNDAMLSRASSFINALVPTRSGQRMLGRYQRFVETHRPPRGHEHEAPNVLEYWREQSGSDTETRRRKFSTLSKLGINFTHSENHKIYFGLTTFIVESALDPRSQYYGAVTSQELRHFYHNRGILCPYNSEDQLHENTVIFVERGNIVAPPWTLSRYQDMFRRYERDIAPGRTRSGSLATQYPARRGAGSTGRGVLPPLVQPVNPLNLADLSHYHAAGVGWANDGDTFSAEFLLFRDHLVVSMATLQAGGLSQPDAQVISAAITNALNTQGAAAQGPHPDPLVQQAVFDQVDIIYGRNLWALLRFFRAHNL